MSTASEIDHGLAERYTKQGHQIQYQELWVEGSILRCVMCDTSVSVHVSVYGGWKTSHDLLDAPCLST